MDVTDEAVVTFSSGRAGSSTPPDLRILHYNDVYHLDSSSAEPVGGIARFVTVCREYREAEHFKGQPGLVTLFSGDVFNPSIESSVTKGNHMVPFLNKIGTDCACVGNHDLDFGVDQFRNLTSKCSFPWLLANVLDPALGEDVPLGHAHKTHMIETSNGLRVGLLGLGEREWLETINALPPNLVYRSASAVAVELAAELRAQGADIVVALTHMREPNDIKLARQTAGALDLILGGHDHFYAHHVVGDGDGNATHVLRSGTDFKQLSYLEVRRSVSRPGKWDVDVWRRDVVAAVREDADTAALVQRLTARLKTSLERPVGWAAAPLDARFTTVRLRESNLGNFVCDIMRCHYGADAALMAGGTIRGDQVYAPGPIRVKDITDCFPFEDPVVVIRASGRAIWEALENGVSLYPALEGRFPQVSNIKFVFDPARPAGERVLTAEIGGHPVDRERTYVLATRGYMVRGKDGYRSLLARSAGGVCDELVSEENGILISMLLRQYFMALKVLDQWKHWGPHMDRHWGSVVSRVGRSHPVMASRSTAPTPATRDMTEPITAAVVGREEEARGEKRTRTRRASTGFLPVAGHAEDDTDHVHEDPNGYNDADDATRRRESAALERELRLVRRVLRKWYRLAGVHGRACDTLDEGEFDVGWTKAVAPRVEGRIRMVGEREREREREREMERW